MCERIDEIKLETIESAKMETKTLPCPNFSSSDDASDDYVCSNPVKKTAPILDREHDAATPVKRCLKF